jgi:DNA helicase-2/ATP-dependent DNA helicase PcrA
MSELNREQRERLLLDLNPEQKKAVTHDRGPLLIIAGAGTGKTKVITHRIAYLIAAKLARPDEILALTFTERAANEMEERVDRLIPYSYSFVEIGTFNSFGEKVLRDYIHELGYGLDFKLLDEVEQAIFFREHLFRFPLRSYRPLNAPAGHIREILSLIRKLKQEGVGPELYLSYARRLKTEAGSPAHREEARKHQEIALVTQRYQRLLRARNLIDFEDQVVLAVELFRRRPSLLKRFQDRFRFVLVDEFQDTNRLQFEMLKLLTAGRDNLTVVGDDDQSIFRFRGASLSNILHFRSLYPAAERVVLGRNYRSYQPILDAAYRLIRHNDPRRLEITERIDKSLLAAREGRGKCIHLLQFDTVSNEADRVADLIGEQVEAGRRYGQCAVLVRRNADADPFLRALNVRGIPFRFSGSRGLYLQPEIRLLLAFIRALTDFDDSRSLFHLAQSEIFQVPLYELTRLSNYAFKKNLSLHLVFRNVAAGRPPLDLAPEAAAAVRRLYEDLMSWLKRTSALSAGRLLYGFIEESGFLAGLAGAGTQEAELKIKNIRLFFDKVKAFSDVAEDDSLQSFARHLDLLRQVGDNPSTAEAELDEDAVQVLTVHKAKGLEFPVVFMVGLIADRFPGIERRERIPFPEELVESSIPSEEESGGGRLREERRLFYVGMTRARDVLYLTWARDYGLKRLKKISPFVLEALDLPGFPENVWKSSALDEIRRYAPREERRSPALVLKETAGLTLSYFRVDDYLVCPRRYQYRHVFRIPVVPDHNLVYGRVLHGVLQTYLKRRKAGENPALEALLADYRARWVNEGYLSREHEEMKKQAGERALRRFFHRESASAERLLFLEKAFKWRSESLRFTGRWDRIDLEPDGAVIIDFKAARAADQEDADRKTRESLQMDLYALSFLKTRDEPLLETRLHFLESDLVGRARKGEAEARRGMEAVRRSEAGIRRGDFAARPSWGACQRCVFRAICPDSYAF